MKRVFFALVALVFVCSCSNSVYTPEFLTDPTLRLESGRQTLFVFEDAACQYSYNRQNVEFRACNDYMSSYYGVRLESLPEAEGQVVVAKEVYWTSSKGVERKKNVSLETVKIEGDTFWLWLRQESVRMTVRFE